MTSVCADRWSEASKTLTIGKRDGAFPGMLEQRTFSVVFVSPNKPAGYSPDSGAGKSVRYDGKQVTVKMD